MSMEGNSNRKCTRLAIMAYPHANIECNLYIKLLHSIQSVLDNREVCGLKLKKNLYIQKQVGYVWYDHLKKGL
eukprot:13286338-Ditylum_brightwellii.AAC.1